MFQSTMLTNKSCMIKIVTLIRFMGRLTPKFIAYYNFCIEYGILKF